MTEPQSGHDQVAAPTLKSAGESRPDGAVAPSHGQSDEIGRDAGDHAGNASAATTPARLGESAASTRGLTRERPKLGNANTARLFAEMSLALGDVEGVQPTADKAVQLALKPLGWDAASVLLAESSACLRPLAYAGDLLQSADEVQLASGDGPCVAAVNQQGPKAVAVYDARKGDSWPHWRAEMRLAGIRNVLVTALDTPEDRLGVLQVCSTDLRVDTEDVVQIGTYAWYVAIAVDTAMRHDALSRAVASRTIIGQAQGKLMERYGLNAQQAMTVLERYAEDTRTDLSRVAEALLTD